MIFYIFVSVLSSFVMFYLVDSGDGKRFVDMNFDEQGAAGMLILVLGCIWPISLPILAMYYGFRYVSQWKKDNGK